MSPTCSADSVRRPRTAPWRSDRGSSSARSRAARRRGCHRISRSPAGGPAQHRTPTRAGEGVDADDRVLTGVLEALVEQATPPGSCRADTCVSMAPSTPPRSVRRSNSCEHRVLDRVGQLSSMMNEPWRGFSFLARPSSRLMMLDGDRPAHGFLGGRGDRLVVGVGVQRVAVVVDRVERLQRRPDVVEGDLLACSDRPEVWMWYLSFWERSALPPYQLRIALAQMRRRPARSRSTRDQCRWRRRTTDSERTCRYACHARGSTRRT
jgi:hypothetical protein